MDPTPKQIKRWKARALARARNATPPPYVPVPKRARMRFEPLDADDLEEMNEELHRVFSV